MKVFTAQCNFINCTCTCGLTSYERNENIVSGGACCFSVSEVIMKTCFFKLCIGEYLGSAVYASTPLNYYTNISCMCDIDCGKVRDIGHSVYAIETSTTEVKDLNSTNSISSSDAGVLFFGKRPSEFTSKYVSIIMNPSIQIARPLGVSAQSNTKGGFIEDAYVRNGNCNGLISIWKGKYKFNNIVFDECSGNIYYNWSDFISITFSNTVFSDEIALLNAQTESCTIVQKETALLMHCKYYKTNNVLCSYIHGCKQTHLHIATIILIIAKEI